MISVARCPKAYSAELVRLRIKEQLEHPCFVAEHHALCQLGILRDSHLVRYFVRRQCFLRLSDHRDFRNGVNPVRKKGRHVFKRFEHMAGREAALLHGGTCKRREADNVPGGVDAAELQSEENSLTFTLPRESTAMPAASR